MSEKPTCRRCGTQHWRFVKCADAEARNGLEAENERRRTVQVVWRTTPGRPWGDDLPNYQRQGENVFWLRRDDENET